MAYINGNKILDISLVAGGVGKSTEQGGEIFNDYENNKALGAYSSASGKNTRAGICGYKILAVDTINYPTVGLTVQGFEDSPVWDEYAVGDIVNLDLVYHHYGIFKITGITDTLNEDYTAWVYVEPIKTITTEDGRTINLYIPPVEELDIETSDDSISWIWCDDKPDAGEIMNHIAPTAFGENTVSTGDGAFVAGKKNKAMGQYAFSGGLLNEANYAAFAINRNNHALGEYSVASGCNSYATKRFASANGDRCVADGESAVAKGAACISSGNGSVAQGRGSKALGDYSFASGLSNEATVNGAIAIGIENKAINYRDVAIGANNEAKGAGSVALGTENIVSSNNGFALGYQNNVIGARSIAIGVGNKPNSADCVAIGNGNICEAGHYTLASGLRCITKYDYTIALGEQCLSQGRASVAMGVKNEAYGSGSVALGLKTVAKGYGQTAIGYYNKVLGAGDPVQKGSDTAIFVVGNGSGDAEAQRHNAFVVYNDNSIQIGDTILTEEKLKKLLALLDS